MPCPKCHPTRCTCLPGVARAVALLGLLGSGPAVAAQPPEQIEEVQAIYGMPPVENEPIACDDFERLEPRAMLGKLDAHGRACLEGHVQGSSEANALRASLMLIQNASSSGDSEWEVLVRRHLGDVDPNDPNLTYKLASFSYKKSRYAGAIRWMEVALANQERWPEGNTRESRVWTASRIRAQAQEQLWKKEPSPEAQEQTRLYAQAWLDAGKGTERDLSKARALCTKAAGEPCD